MSFNCPNCRKRQAFKRLLLGSIFLNGSALTAVIN